jgi:hypothetical protein
MLSMSHKNPRNMVKQDEDTMKRIQLTQYIVYILYKYMILRELQRTTTYMYTYSTYIGGKRKGVSPTRSLFNKNTMEYLGAIHHHPGPTLFPPSQGTGAGILHIIDIHI